MKLIDVAHLWLHNEIRSNWLRVSRVKSEHSGGLGHQCAQSGRDREACTLCVRQHVEQPTVHAKKQQPQSKD